MSVVVDEYIDLLLRDTARRLGLSSMESRPVIWAKLMNPHDPLYFLNRKRASYVLNSLLDSDKLTNSFLEYFKYKTAIQINDDVNFLDDSGNKTTLSSFFKYKLSRFKSNFSYNTRKRYKVTISKGGNETGGKGNKLKVRRSPAEVLLLRRYKRMLQKEQEGKISYLNMWMTKDTKTVMVRHRNVY